MDTIATHRRRPRWRAPRLALVLAIAAAVLLVPVLVDFYTDWLWFGEIGARQVFVRSLTTRLVLGLAVGAVSFAVLFLNLMLALRAVRPRELVLQTREGQMPIAIDPVRLRPIVTLAAGGLALALALSASGQWLAWLSYRHAAPFPQADPILHWNVGFYVFGLPLLAGVEALARTLVVLTLAGVAALYYVAGAVTIEGGMKFTAQARRHLAVLVATLLLVLAFSAWLDVPRLLTSPSGVVHGATYADIEARLPALRLLLVASVVGAGLAAYATISPAIWPVVAGGALYGLVALGGPAYAALVQRFIVGPNEQVKETPFIVYNIAATRQAFALDHVERELSGDAVLTRGEIDANAATLKNVRLWDHQPLLDTFGQIQEIRTYYDFVSVDNDRYVIDGEYRQIMLSGRELNAASLPNRSWINERLTFTHGYGLTLGPVNQVTPEGLPVLFIKNLPLESSVDLTVSEPSIYYGERSSDYVVVGTSTREFHYPKGDDNVYDTYGGDGGVPVGGWLRKLVFSLRFRSLKMLLSNDITAGSRVLFHRQIAGRVGRIAPFLQYDEDPYLVIAGGRLVWIQDAYTTARTYPYSTPSRAGINYIRNSVKATVDAYHGTTRFYLADPEDPVAGTLTRIFPGLFRPLEEMPAELRRHVRYPEGIFRVQAAIYSTYHMTNPAVFYNKEDQWEVATTESGGQASPMQPYYTIMKLPGERTAEFIQMLPFTPSRKDNLAAWMVARSDGADYGRLLVFRFPKQKVIFGPRQVVARINQDQAISPQITLWNQQGSEVIQGTLLVIPIEESLIYIRPLYLRAQGGRIPELKRVIVAYQNQIVMEQTLEEALERLFPTGPPGRAARTGEAQAPPAPESPPAAPGDDLAARARDHYRRAIQAQRDGDWTRYGEEIRRLGEVLEQMAARKKG